MHKCFQLFVWCSFLVGTGLFPNITIAQNLMGTTGLVTIPTARMADDGTVSTGASYFDKKYQEYFEGTKNIGHAYINITFLPFLELAFRVNRPFHYKNKGTTDDFYIVDRSPMVRLRLFKEKKYRPAILMGLHDFASTTSNESVFYNATYLVFSKQIKHFDLHLGYAPPIMKARYYQLNGLFGGIAYTPRKGIQLQTEYDSRTFNTGIQIELLKHIGIQAAAINFDSWAAGMNFRFIL